MGPCLERRKWRFLHPTSAVTEPRIMQPISFKLIHIANTKLNKMITALK